MILLAFLFPLAVYCLILAFVNRAPHPVLISGRWDFIGLLFASSGILLLGGPSILNGLYEQRRLAWAVGDAHFLPGVAGESWHFWISLWIGYFGLVLGAAAVLLWRRGSMTAIYNIDSPRLAAVFGQVFQRLDVVWTRSDERILVQPAEAGASSDLHAYNPEALTISIDSFPAMHHAALYWRGENTGLRKQIESELARALADVQTSYNPAGAWLLAVSASLFSVTFFGMALFVFGLLVRSAQR